MIPPPIIAGTIKNTSIPNFLLISIIVPVFRLINKNYNFLSTTYAQVKPKVDGFINNPNC
jgi:hypothetical protein